MSKRLETVATMACMKTLLMLFNFVFWASGILILCTSIGLRFQLRDYVDKSMDGSGAVLLALACLGAILTLVATLACCCTAHGHPALLYLYGAFLAVIALLDFGVGASIYAYRSSLNEKLDKSINDSMQAYGMEDGTMTIAYMQSTLQCCGNKGYMDWYNVYFQKVPESCCKVAQEICDTNDMNDIYTEGCYNRVSNLIEGNIALLAGTAAGGAFLPAVGVFLACCLANNINKAKQASEQRVAASENPDHFRIPQNTRTNPGKSGQMAALHSNSGGTEFFA